MRSEVGSLKYEVRCPMYDLFHTMIFLTSDFGLPASDLRLQIYFIPGNQVLPSPTTSLNGQGIAASINNNAINNNNPVAL